MASTAGYMKPVSVSVVRTGDALLDEDAVFIRQHFGLTDPLDKIAPVLVTQRVVEGIIRGQQVDYSKQLREAYIAISRDEGFCGARRREPVGRRLAGRSRPIRFPICSRHLCC